MEHRSERRLVTCVFIDVVGSTDLGQRLGPERMRLRLDDAFGHISSVAVAEGGTIEKYIGDEIFVLFGAPTAHADDVLRALRTAEAAIRWAETTEALRVRVGIETGEALVDLEAVGERQRMAVGTCVNLAARLQQLADPGQVIVGPTCRAAAGDQGEFDDLGTVKLKGLGDTRAWRLARLTESGPIQLPFVGRRAELDRLTTAFRQAAAGRATLAVITGPPGIGKSSLLREFTRSLGDKARVLEARWRPGTETGSSPLRQLVEGVDVERLPRGVAFSAGLRSDDGLLALLVIDRRNEIYVGWRDYLADLARDRPVLLCIEDLHWAESEVVRLIDRLTFDTGLRLMIMASARPEFPGMPLLRPKEDRLVIELQPLDPESASALARSARGRDVSIERAQGHPLFIVELVRARESDGPMPVTLQAAISARLDELPVRERELLQTAAVIGETFDVHGASLLAERDPSEVAGILGRLSHLRYIQPVDGGFRFNHALVHEIAYGRLPIATRLRLHAQYAVEGLGAEDVETLAHHWWEALGPSDAAWVWEGNAELDQMRAAALRSLVAAGGGLGDRFAFERATQIFERALLLARHPEESAMVEEAFGLACARNAMGEDAGQHRMRAIALYREAGLEAPVGLYADMLDLTVFNWGYYKHPPSFDEVVRVIDEGVAAARRTDDSVNLLRLLVQRGFFTNDATVLPETSRLLEGAADLRPHANGMWRFALVHFLVSRDLDRALDLLERAFSLARDGAALNEPEALMWRSNAYFHAGDLTRADADADRLLEIGRFMSPHTRQHGLGTKGRILAARGDWPGVIAHAKTLRTLVRENPDASFCLIGANLIGYAAVAELMTGQPLPDDLETLAERLLPDATATRAAALLVPLVMAARPVSEDDARRAYAPETPIFDREAIWDLSETHFALANAMRGRWTDVERLLPQLDAMADRGAIFASALAAALREEQAAATGGAKPTHDALRSLGYLGISELLSYRVH
jgi:class 3 adenylate cyclase/tetratricopeptide (TPR) repeat protein